MLTRKKKSIKIDYVRVQSTEFWMLFNAVGIPTSTTTYTITELKVAQGGGSPSFTSFMGKKLRVLNKGRQVYVLITVNQARTFEKKLGIKTKDATHVFGRSRKTVENRGHTYALVPMKTLQTVKKTTPIQR
jgi:hypothetical protein